MPTADPDPSLPARARFPRSLDDLRSTTQCPACFTRLTAQVCSNCHLDLSGASAARLAIMSTDAAALLEDRISFIGDMRASAAEAVREAAAARAQRSAAQAAEDRAAAVAAQAAEARAAEAAQAIAVRAAASAQRSVFAAPVEAAPVAAAPVEAAPVAAAAPGFSAAAPPAPPLDPRRGDASEPSPRRSSIQVLLVIVGVSLVSVAAIFFLVFAFINFGILWRSLIIAAITVSAFAIASLLRRKRLPSTAEGIGAFAVVLLLLDAFAVRANDLFGSASSDGYVYWGATLVSIAIIVAAWHRLSRLRVGSIAAFSLLAPGVGILVAGLTGPLDTGMRVLLTSLAVVAAGLVHPLASRLASSSTSASGPRRPALPERIVVLSFSALAAVVSGVAGLVVGQGTTTGPVPGTTSAALLATAGMAALHVVALARGGRAARPLRLFAFGFAGFSGITVSIAAAMAGYDLGTSEPRVGVGAVASAAVALLFVVVAIRTSARTARGLLVTVASGATLIAAFAVLAPLAVAVTFAATAPLLALSAPWSISATGAAVDVTPTLVYCIAALAVVVALCAVAARIAGVLRPAGAALTWAVTVVAILAVSLHSVLAAVVAGWFFLTLAALALLIARRAGLQVPLAIAVQVGLAAIVSAVLAFTTSWASTSTWLGASIVTIGLLVASRAVFPPARSGALLSERGRNSVRAALLGVAVVVALIATVAGARSIVAARLDAADPTMDSLRFVTALGILLLVVSLPPAARGVSAIDRAVVFLSGAVLVVVSAPVGALLGAGTATPTVLAEPLAALVLAIALLASLVGWLVARSGLGVQFARSVAAVGLAPSVFWVIDSLFAVASPDSPERVLAPVVSSLIVASAVLAIAAARPAFRSRGAADLGVGLGVLGGALAPAVTGSGLDWLCLLLGALAVLLLAIDGRELGAAVPPRKHLGWVALALATAGVSTWLGLYALATTGVFLIAVSLVRVIRGVTLHDRTAAFAVGALLVAVGAPAAAAGRFAPASPSAITEPLIALLLAASLLASLICWLTLRAGADLPPARGVAAAALLPGTWWLTDSILAVAAPDSALRVFAAIASSLLVAAAVFAASAGGRGAARPSLATRLTADTGVAIGVAAGIVVTFVSDSEFAWLSLCIGAVTVLLLAISTEGLDAPDFRRKYLGWVSLALATACLYEWLGMHSITAAGVALTALSLSRSVRRVSLLDRAAAFGVGMVLVAVSAPLAAIGGGNAPTPTALSDSAISLALAVSVLATIAGWLAGRSGADLPWARAVAAVGLAPSTYWLIDSVFALADPDSTARVLAPIASSLLVAAAALVASTRRASFRSRTMADLGVAAGVIAGTALPLASGSDFAWLCLLIGAVTVLLLSVSGEGSPPRRSRLAWVALALATAGLWTWLAAHSVVPVEPYVLPLSGALLAIAAVIERTHIRRQPDAATPGIAHHLVLAALLVAVLPIAVASLDGSLTRAIVVSAAAAVLLLAGSVPESTKRARQFLDALAGVGASGLLLVTAGRAAGVGGGAASGGGVLDVWLGLAFAVLVVAALGQARVDRTGRAARVPAIAGRALLVAAMALVLPFELHATGGDAGWVRVVVLVVVFATVHVLGAVLDRAPFDTVVGWVALGFSALVAAIGVRGDIVPTLEWVTVPLAVALLSSGAVRLARHPAARSWTTLAPGLAVLLVLPLLATLEDRPGWRLLAIGVFSVAALVVGVLRRLQAPFLIGAVVALVHGIATFSPQIVAVYQLTEWWWWAAPAGIIIIILGTRLERSVATTRNVTASIGALR
jgi:hypothetical protein